MPETWSSDFRDARVLTPEEAEREMRETQTRKANAMMNGDSRWFDPRTETWIPLRSDADR